MARIESPISDLHIPLKKIRELRAADYRAIDGPKFITGHGTTLAVVISPDKWRALNHNLPNVNPHKIEQFFVGEQGYLTIPVERDTHNCWRPIAKTGLEIITRRGPRKKAVA